MVMKWGTLWWSVAGLAVHIAGRACHSAGGMAVQAGHGVPPDAGIARCSAVHRLLHPQLPRHGATRAVVSAGGGMRLRGLRLRGGRGRGGGGDQFAEDTAASIYSGSMPQDISSEDEDQNIVDALSTRNHVIENPEPTEIEKMVKETIAQAKMEEGSLPNPRYMNLTAAEERQLELDELLWFAAEHGELGLAREALESGANVSSTNAQFFNQTALHCAAQFGAGHPEIIRLLAEHGADVNARNCHNNTALHEAAYWGYAQVVASLLGCGADATAVNARGLTPLLNAEGNWAAVARPTLGLDDLGNSSMLIQDHPTHGGWRHRLRTPAQRKEVVDMLKEAMGPERVCGRGVDAYCGGVDFPDQWDQWNEEAEHYNPLSRPREFATSLPPFVSPLEEPLKGVRPMWAPCKEMERELDQEIEQIWQRDKWRYYELHPDESMSSEAEQRGAVEPDAEESSAGKDEGHLITQFDAAGPDAGGEDAGLEDAWEGGPNVDDDGTDAEGAVQKELDSE